MPAAAGTGDRFMASLTTENRMSDADSAYRALIDAHRGLSDEDSAMLNTRLVLILANHIGDRQVLDEAIALAARAGKAAERTG